MEINYSLKSLDPDLDPMFVADNLDKPWCWSILYRNPKMRKNIHLQSKFKELLQIEKERKSELENVETLLQNVVDTQEDFEMETSTCTVVKCENETIGKIQ